MFDHAFEVAILRNLLAQTSRAYEERLADVEAEKELAQVTLASIGDGVVTTDTGGRVTFFNPVAEKRTGTTTALAAGRPLAEVFQIVEETSGDPVMIPIADRVWNGNDEERTRDLVLVRPDAERFALECRAAPTLAGSTLCTASTSTSSSRSTTRRATSRGIASSRTSPAGRNPGPRVLAGGTGTRELGVRRDPASGGGDPRRGAPRPDAPDRPVGGDRVPPSSQPPARRCPRRGRFRVDHPLSRLPPGSVDDRVPARCERRERRACR